MSVNSQQMPVALADAPQGYAQWLEIVQQSVGLLPWGRNLMLPVELQTSLLSIEQIERDLGGLEE